VTYASATAIFVSRLNLNLLTEKLPSLLQWFFFTVYFEGSLSPWNEVSAFGFKPIVVSSFGLQKAL